MNQTAGKPNAGRHPDWAGAISPGLHAAPLCSPLLWLRVCVGQPFSQRGYLPFVSEPYRAPSATRPAATHWTINLLAVPLVQPLVIPVSANNRLASHGSLHVELRPSMASLQPFQLAAVLASVNSHAVVHHFFVLQVISFRPKRPMNRLVQNLQRIDDALAPTG